MALSMVDRDQRVVELEGEALKRSGLGADEFPGHRLPDAARPRPGPRALLALLGRRSTATPP